MINVEYIVRNIPDYVKNATIDIVRGVYRENGKSLDCYRITLDRTLTTGEKEYLLMSKKIIKVTECSYRYAPEIKKSVVYLKAGK